MIVEDEHGWQWLTQSGDPVDKLANALRRQGYQRIVLPRKAISTGHCPPPPDEESLTRETDTYRQLRDSWGEGSGDVLEILSAAFLRRMALYDTCIAAQNMV